MNNIDQIYCICLDKRKSHMNNFFKIMNIKKYIYVNPILGSSLRQHSESDFVSKNILHVNNKLKSKNKIYFNKIANTLSFIKTLKLFLSTKSQNCLILEDDLYIPNDRELQLIQYKLLMLFEKVNKDWQYINLGRCWDKSCQRPMQQYDDKYINVQHCLPVCTHAILIKRDMAEYLVKNTFPLKLAKDVTWRRLIHEDKYWKKYSYCSVPAIFKQDRIKLGSHLGNNKVHTENNQCNGDKHTIKRFKIIYSDLL